MGTHAVLVVAGAELRGPLVPEGALGTGEVVGHAVGALAEGGAVGGLLHVHRVVRVHGVAGLQALGALLRN